MSANLLLAASNATFGILDWLVVAVYFVVVIGIGVWTSREQVSKRDYFLGGRNLSWWIVGLSIIATETSALTFIGVPAIAFGALKIGLDGSLYSNGGNMFFLNLIIGYVLGRIIIAFFIVPYYFTGDVYTPFQLLKRAFGKSTRFVGAGLSLVGLSLGAGVRVLVTAIPVTIVMQTAWSGWTLWMSIVLIMAAALVYTAIGGIKAVVWTDMIQYFIFVLGGLFAVIYIPTLLNGSMAAPSGAEGWSAIGEVAGENLQWWNTGFVSTAKIAGELGREPGFFEWLGYQLRSILSGDFNLVMGIFPQTLGIILAFGFDQLNVQRVLACKDEKQGKKAMLLSGFLIFPQFFLFLLIGVCLYAFYKINGFQFGAVQPWDPATVKSDTGMGNPVADYVFPIFIVSQVPTIMKGFLVAGILAAAMSSVSGALSAMSSITVMDFLRPIRGAADEKSELRISVITTWVSGVLLGVIAFVCKEQQLILELAFKVAGLTGGAILGAFLYGMIQKRAHPVPVIFGMIASFLFMVLYNNLRAGKIISINWPWDASIGMAVCLIVTYWFAGFYPEPKDGDIRTATANE